MKVKRFYKESANVEDMSQDRVQLNLSYQEWAKLRDLIELLEWHLPLTNDSNEWIRRRAKNIKIMFKKAQEEEPEWY